MVFGKVVEVEPLGKDRYGRLIANVFADGVNVNHALVRNGMAWWYRKYAPNDKTLGNLEWKARRDRRGLWSHKNPMPAWDWRRV